MPDTNQLQVADSAKVAQIQDAQTEAQKLKKWRYYRLIFRHRNRVFQKYFEFEGNLIEARKAANEHCIEFGYKYIWVRPLIVNLNEQAQLRRYNPDFVDESEDLL